ncbi:MAG: RNA polymerase sigma factor [Pseudomonadota bacterium]
MSKARKEIELGLEQRLTRLWRFGLILSGDQAAADDLVQSTCIRALERAEQFIPGTNLDAWLFTILSSIWRNMVRSSAVRRGAGLVEIGDALLEAEDCNDETRVYLLQTLSRIDLLPEGQRQVMLLVGVEGLTHAEAAGILKIPAGTVMSRMFAARKSLKSGMHL